VNDALTCGQANFIKVFSTINTYSVAITFYLKTLNPFSFSSLLNAEMGRSFLSCLLKVRNSNRKNYVQGEQLGFNVS
jgi:hypothetical protein